MGVPFVANNCLDYTKGQMIPVVSPVPVTQIMGANNQLHQCGDDGQRSVVVGVLTGCRHIFGVLDDAGGV
jgi:hypothetical protein